MKKPLALLVVTVLVVALTIPAVALASSSRAADKKGQVRSSRGIEVAPVERDSTTQASKPFKQASKATAKSLKSEAKVTRKATKAEAKAIRKGLAAPSLESSPTSPSVETTKAVGPGVANALKHIIANIMRKFEKFGADRVSPGLMSVWEKFSMWLGGDTTMKPWETSSTVPPIGDQDPSVLPSVSPVPTL